jgi:predicted nucleic acid-binding protein
VVTEGHEVTRNRIQKWNMPLEKARRREGELRRHFPEAWIEGFEPLIEVMTNNPGDRHVLAAAVRAHADLIVTYNRRHFPAASAQTWEIEVQGPSTFLRGLYDLDAGLFAGKLHEQAAAVGVSLTRLRAISRAARPS